MKRTAKYITLLGLSLFGLAMQASSPTTYADISGSGIATAIATAGYAHWVLVLAADTNATTACSTATITGCPRVGDVNVSKTQGIPLLPGAAIFLPSDANASAQYNLANIYYLVQSGDEIHILTGN